MMQVLISLFQFQDTTIGHTYYYQIRISKNSAKCLGASYNNVRLRFPKKESVDQERSKQVVEDDQKTS